MSKIGFGYLNLIKESVVISFSVCIIKDEKSVFLLQPSIWEYFADPFILGVDGNRTYVLVEVYQRLQRKGNISLLIVDYHRQSYSLQPLINEAHHLSYPCVIHIGSDDYVMPESESASAQYIYRLEWEQGRLCARKTAALQGRYVDFTIRLDKGGKYNAEFYNGSSNGNGFLFEVDLRLDAEKQMQLGEMARIKGKRRPGGRIDGGAQPYQRSGVDYGGGLDFIDESGLLVSPDILGLPMLVSALQNRMHHLSQSHGRTTFDIKSKVAPRFIRQVLFASAAQVQARIETD